MYKVPFTEQPVNLADRRFFPRLRIYQNNVERALAKLSNLAIWPLSLIEEAYGYPRPPNIGLDGEDPVGIYLLNPEQNPGLNPILAVASTRWCHITKYNMRDNRGTDYGKAMTIVQIQTRVFPDKYGLQSDRRMNHDLGFFDWNGVIYDYYKQMILAVPEPYPENPTILLACKDTLGAQITAMIAANTESKRDEIMARRRLRLQQTGLLFTGYAWSKHSQFPEECHWAKAQSFDPVPAFQDLIVRR